MDSVAANSLCSSIYDGSSDATKLAAFKCYANVYWQNKPSSGCNQEYDFNWDATTSADFVRVRNRQTPDQNYVTNIVNYSADGSSWTLEDHQDGGTTVSTGTNNSTFCHTDQMILLKGTKVSDTKMLVELNQSTTLKDTLVPACVAAANDTVSNGGSGSQLYQQVNGNNGKSMFYLTK
jgi:hypothetical protein